MYARHIFDEGEESNAKLKGSTRFDSACTVQVLRLLKLSAVLRNRIPRMVREASAGKANVGFCKILFLIIPDTSSNLNPGGIMCVRMPWNIVVEEELFRNYRYLYHFERHSKLERCRSSGKLRK